MYEYARKRLRVYLEGMMVVAVCVLTQKQRRSHLGSNKNTGNV